MTVDLLITDATVVNAHGTSRGHVSIRDGVIRALHSLEDADLPTAARTIDAGGRLLIPGGVDAHCHVEQVTGAYKSLDTFETATIGAVHGGTTTIIDFGIPANPSESPRDALENKLGLLAGARCSVALHGSVIQWDDSTAAQLDWMAGIGVPSVKLYTTNRGTTMADEDTLVRVMKEMARLGGLTYVHCEHDAIIVDRTACCAEADQVSIDHLHHTRPAVSEDASVREVLAIAEYAGAPVYLVHQTTPEAVDAAREARARGRAVYSETCPHYLLWDDSVYAGETPERYACCPPMRPVDAVRGLNDRVAWGHVDVVASDHSCYDLIQKREHRDDVRKMPHGLPGVQTRMPATFTALVVRRGLPVERFVEVFATAPARINGLVRKGAVAVGHDADLVLFDPDETRQVVGPGLRQGTDFSPFDGMDLRGWPSTVVAGGHVVIDDGSFADPGPVGSFVPRLGFRQEDR